MNAAPPGGGTQAATPDGAGVGRTVVNGTVVVEAVVVAVVFEIVVVEVEVGVVAVTKTTELFRHQQQ